MQQLKQQLDYNIDRNCTPMGGCGAYGYTMVGKGTTSWLWPHVSREAEVYSVLQQAQGKFGICSLWRGGVSDIGHYEKLRPEIKRSKREIRSLGVLHEDIRPDNILWNAELGRALIIDFHLSTLDSQRIQKQMRQLKGRPCGTEAQERKRLRAVY